MANSAHIHTQIFSKQGYTEVVTEEGFVVTYENYLPHFAQRKYVWICVVRVAHAWCFGFFFFFLILMAFAYILELFFPNFLLYFFGLHFSFEVFTELKCSIVKAVIHGNNMLSFVCINEIIILSRDALKWKISERGIAHQLIWKSWHFLKCFIHKPCESLSTWELF